MATIKKNKDVDVPVRTAYNQWTQFEEFPRFMEGVRSVKQLDDKRLQWHAQIFQRDERWTAEIVEQIPDKRIAWRSTSGSRNDGVVEFQPIDGDHTRITLQIDYEPEDTVENVGAALGVVAGRVEGDLQRFKEFIEKKGRETGAWRGRIEGERVEERSR
jgi:uncharacterized membrane protein